jgi:uncharacterized membrane protein/thiol-disulfide isomerase/thioredoxin
MIIFDNRLKVQSLIGLCKNSICKRIPIMATFIHMNKLRFPIILSIIILFAIYLFGFITPSYTSAQAPQVKAILFYSPTCGHCEKVIKEDIPPLLEKYANQFILIKLDVNTQMGQELYKVALDYYQIPPDRMGVPTLIIGDTILVGSSEIPEKLPGILETGLVLGGIDWPDMPGLSQLIKEKGLSQNNTNNQLIATTYPTPLIAQSTNTELEELNKTESSQSITSSFYEKFSRDVAGNTIAVITLFAMLACIIGVGVIFISDKSIRAWPEWTIIILALIGLGVAIYLTFIETTQSEAFCGPVGDCNSVQQSPYALLFGLIPVGLLGIVGYIFILISWIIRHFTQNQKIRNIFTLTIWIMAWFGVFFSIYLTFLEPFVIGATCMWCITSAVVMTLILIAVTTYVKEIYSFDDEASLTDDDLDYSGKAINN